MLEVRKILTEDLYGCKIIHRSPLSVMDGNILEIATQVSEICSACVVVSPTARSSSHRYDCRSVQSNPTYGARVPNAWCQMRGLSLQLIGNLSMEASFVAWITCPGFVCVMVRSAAHCICQSARQHLSPASALPSFLPHVREPDLYLCRWK